MLRYAKAIVALLGTALGAINQLPEYHGRPWVTLGIGLLTTLGVYLTPNALTPVP